jgi:prepilin-type N-terminal cleavage/methylation domain-containing protein
MRPGRTVVRKPRRGYTLLEVSLVLALMVVVAAIAYPSLDAMYGDVRVTAGADAIRAAWASARAHAMNEGRSYQFAVAPGHGRYRVAPEGSDFGGGSDAVAGDADPSNPPLILEEALPKGLRFASGDAPQAAAVAPGHDAGQADAPVDPGSWTTLVTFLADGRADQDVEIILSYPGARSLCVKLRSFTGAVTVQPVPLDQTRR